MARYFGEGSVDDLINHEWLLPLGQGGYASGTTSGVRSRAYHGLLVGACPAPRGRRLLVSHVDETWRADDAGGGAETALLATHVYAGDDGATVVHPHGYRHVVDVAVEADRVTWQFDVGTARIAKDVVVAGGRNEVVVRYRLVDGVAGDLILRPFLTDRSFHGGPQARLGNGVVSDDGLTANWMPDDEETRVYVAIDRGVIHADEIVHRDYYYAQEKQRGLGDREDVGSPFEIRVRLTGDEVEGDDRMTMVFADDAAHLANAAKLDGVAIDHAPINVTPTNSSTGTPRDDASLRRRLEIASRAFVVTRPGEARPGVVAGYHWFGEWGRDTMLALPGLALAVDRDELFAILRAWADRISLGMLPNRLADAEPDDLYNSVDASLFFARAVERLLSTESDDTTLVELLPVLVDIATHYTRGTRFDIHVDPEDGLLHAGSPTTQLTWMDAQTSMGPATPRHGKCVEVNALFHGLLRFLADVHRRRGHRDDARRYRAMAGRLERSFRQRFVDDRHDHLADRVMSDDVDFALRPNQLFAISESRPLVSRRRARRILDVVETRLVTDFGLRTLEPGDANYIGRYAGGPDARDAAYHQGTVWPWLWGPYVEATIRVRGGRSGAAARAKARLARFLGTLDEAGVGFLSEVFDGDSPHRPGGTIAQAWSVTECLRAWALLGDD